MSFSFCVLGSGSSGNSTLLTASGRTRHILIDAGLSPRMTARRLADLGLDLASIGDILLTHLDADHFRPTWLKAAARHGIRIHLHRGHHRGVTSTWGVLPEIKPFADEFEIEGVGVRAVRLAHDESGTFGFVFQRQGTRLGFATDLGRVSEDLIQMFADLDALAIESNYDPRMQIESSRPWFLKRRIMGGSGHLSNEQSLEAVLRMAGTSRRLRHVALLHLSQQCNDPGIIRRLYRERAPQLLERVTITSQFQPTPLLHVAAQPGAAMAANLFETALV